ncbi:MAG: FAD-dependent oxidoreductase [Ignavibacteriae bacterium]|nr:FAD-dependent oxidoreductase [Ignavibacteriota bacterium]
MKPESTEHNNVLIIGGGVIGLCSAYYLSKSGAQVAVIDKGEFGHGSSLHNAGYVCPSHFIPLASPGIISQGLKWMLSPTSPFYIKPRLDPDFIRWAWHFKRSCTKENVDRAMPLLRDLGVASLALYKEFAAMKAFDFDWTERGLLTLFRSEKSKHHCEVEAELAHKLGIRAQMLTQSELQQLIPEVEVRAEGGLYFPDDCHMTPAKFVEGLAGHLESGGVNLVRNTVVSGFKVQGNRIVEVKTSKGNFSADEFVLAGGSWSPDIARELGVKLLIQAGKGYSVTIERADRKPAIPLIFSEARVAVTPMGNAIRFAGTMEIAGLDTSITHRRVEAIINSIPNYIGGYDKSDFATAEPWAGLRPVSPDGLPHLGRSKKHSNLIVAAGHAMVGISLATITGKLVAEIAEGRKPSFDLTLLDPSRFD